MKFYESGGFNYLTQLLLSEKFTLKNKRPDVSLLPASKNALQHLLKIIFHFMNTILLPQQQEKLLQTFPYNRFIQVMMRIISDTCKLPDFGVDSNIVE